MKPFDIFADALKLYCAEHHLDYAKVKASPKCGNETTLLVQRISNAKVGPEKEEPSEILLSVVKDENGEVHITQYKNAERCLGKSEPMPSLSAAELKERFENTSDVQELADAFAIASNEFWWTVDDEYDFEEGSTGHQATCAKADEWEELMKLCEKRILEIIRSEGIEIPSKGRIAVLAPFMKKYGYEDGNGWWIKSEQSEH